MLSQHARIGMAFGAGLSVAACATPTLDSALVAQLAYIRIVDKAPSNCRYLTEAVSYRFLVSELGIDVAGGEKQLEAMHDTELRKQAKSVGGNVVYTALIHRTGFAFMMQVNVFYAC
jgi:homoserine dehydrogenase